MTDLTGKSTNAKEPDMGAPAVDSPPASRSRKVKQPGSRIGAKAVVATAMLNAGSTYREIQQATGISSATIAGLKQENLASPEHVERIRKGLRDQATMLASTAMGKITGSKLDELSADRIMVVAEKAAKIAGVSAPSSHEHFFSVLHAYTTTGSVSSQESGPTIINPRKDTEPNA